MLLSILICTLEPLTFDLILYIQINKRIDIVLVQIYCYGIMLQLKVYLNFHSIVSIQFQCNIICN